ncbi:wall-associated receptor kinase 2-like [Amaranthus tricolor]|uniref:wall-associated receptor kinase 2-like n=1 Tax=Amaranthus tricolor TaxID=29722 RepID=UPI002585F989|nr:wall-associated receptor kinase 2-like [Amaranthus tricolor]
MVFPWFALFLCSVIAVERVLITATNTTKPGCQTKCGNISVPYPFGIGSECSIEHSYSLICNTSYNPPKLFFSNAMRIQSSILNITETKLLITNTYFVSACFESQPNNVKTSISGDSLITFDDIDPFFYSYSNKFTVVGCDIYGMLDYNDDFDKKLSTCLAVCSGATAITYDDPNHVPNGYCQAN